MSISREVLLPATPDEVWPVVTEADQLSAWFGADVEGDLEPGAVVHFSGEEDRMARVVEVEPSRRVSWDWWPVDGTEAPSHVELTLEEVEEGTRLVVVETGPRHPVASIGVPGLRMHLRALARC
jgi:uncharacterized protein YndB with AHSA1/START domain